MSIGDNDLTPETGESLSAESEQGVLTGSSEIKRSEIFNKTPLRIGIKSKYYAESGESEYLVISPFSSKVISEDTKEDFNYQRWA
jgi:hypothetical protein